MTWDEMMAELCKEYPDVIGKAERIAEQLSGHISKLDAYEVLTKCYNHRLEVQHEALREALSRVPTIDVAPVVHGRWKDAIQSCHDSPHVRCSVCGEYYWYYFKKFSYCPKCGAKMDKGDV